MSGVEGQPPTLLSGPSCISCIFVSIEFYLRPEHVSRFRWTNTHAETTVATFFSEWISAPNNVHIIKAEPLASTLMIVAHVLSQMLCWSSQPLQYVTLSGKLARFCFWKCRDTSRYCVFSRRKAPGDLSGHRRRSQMALFRLVDCSGRQCSSFCWESNKRDVTTVLNLVEKNTAVQVLFLTQIERLVWCMAVVIWEIIRERKADHGKAVGMEIMRGGKLFNRILQLS